MMSILTYFIILTVPKTFLIVAAIGDETDYERVTFVKSTRGKYLALHDGYQYHKHRDNVNGTITWRCVQFGSQSNRARCTGVICTKGDTIVKRKIHSTCKQDFIKNETSKLEHRWMSQIDPNEVSVPKVLEEMSKECDAAGLKKPTYKRVWNLIAKEKAHIRSRQFVFLNKTNKK